MENEVAGKFVKYVYSPKNSFFVVFRPTFVIFIK